MTPRRDSACPDESLRGALRASLGPGHVRRCDRSSDFAGHDFDHLTFFVFPTDRGDLCLSLAGRLTGRRHAPPFWVTPVDTTGAPCPTPKITVTNVDTNFSRTTLTDATGEYRFLSLAHGTYTVEAERDGFQKFVAGNIVSVDQQRRVDIPMQVGSLQQRVEVNAAAVQVETTNTQLGTVIDEKNIVNLPLNGRSYIDLLSIQAGVAPTSGTGGPGLISVNGQRQESNSFLVNGGDVNEGRRMTAGVVPNLDSVAEFRLITNSFDAEYGRFSGAVMNAITKSGTNGLHGAAFEFLRNSDMDARAFFDPAVTVLKRNQFGYAVGGPALKNKLFWFTDYQGTRERRGTSGSLSQLPSVAQRSGAFSPGDLNGEVSGGLTSIAIAPWNMRSSCCRTAPTSST